MIIQEGQCFLLAFGCGEANGQERGGGWCAELRQPGRCSPAHRLVVQIPRWGRADQEPSKHFREQDSQIDNSFPAKAGECRMLIIHPRPTSKMGDWRAQKAFSMWQERVGIFFYCLLFTVPSSENWRLYVWTDKQGQHRCWKIYPNKMLVGKASLKMPVWWRGSAHFTQLFFSCFQ